MSKPKPLSDMAHADLGNEARRIEAELQALHVEVLTRTGLELVVERTNPIMPGEPMRKIRVRRISIEEF